MNSSLPHKFVCILSMVAMSSCAGMRPDPRAGGQAMVLVQKGIGYLEQGDLPLAEASFRVAAENDQIPEAYDGLACIAFLQGKVREAESLFRNVITWYPEYLPAKQNLALLYDLIGDNRRAASYYQSLLEQDPLNYAVRNNYGMLLREEGREALAKTYIHDAYVILKHPISNYNMHTQDGR